MIGRFQLQRCRQPVAAPQRPVTPIAPLVGTARAEIVKAAVVTLTLIPPTDPTLVANRELSFDPAPIDPPNPRIVAGNAATVDGLRWPVGTSVSGTITDISPRGTRSAAVNFHVDASPSETVAPPAAPTMGGVNAVDVADPANVGLVFGSPPPLPANAVATSPEPATQASTDTEHIAESAPDQNAGRPKPVM